MSTTVSRLKLRSRETRDARAVLAGTASAAAAEVESALEVPPDPTAGAFFDVDNTIVAGASIYHFARGLAARDFITTRDIARLRLAAGEVPGRRQGVGTRG